MDILALPDPCTLTIYVPDTLPLDPQYLLARREIDRERDFWRRVNEVQEDSKRADWWFWGIITGVVALIVAYHATLELLK